MQTVRREDTSVTMFIRSFCEEVFDLIVDTSRHGEYVKGYEDKLKGPKVLSRGGEFIWRIKLYNTVFRVYSFVSGLEYPRRYEERIHVPGLFRAAYAHILEEGEGGAQFTCTWRFEPVSWSASGLLAERLMNGPDTIRQIALDSIAGMRRLLEGGDG